MHTIIQFYSRPDVDDRVDREEKRQHNMHTMIQFYSPPDVDDRVDREEKRNNQTT